MGARKYRKKRTSLSVGKIIQGTAKKREDNSENMREEKG